MVKVSAALFCSTGSDGGDDALDILRELNTGWEQSQQRVIELRFELRDSMTEEEWAALFAGD